MSRAIFGLTCVRGGVGEGAMEGAMEGWIEGGVVGGREGWKREPIGNRETVFCATSLLGFFCLVSCPQPAALVHWLQIAFQHKSVTRLIGDGSSGLYLSSSRVTLIFYQ